jgi:hypothetical protein
MALEGAELKRRIEAAAALYGLKYGEVRRVLVDYGTDMTLAEAMVSGKKPIRDKQIDELATVFALPRAWFEVEDWRSLIHDAPPSDSELATRARERAARALGKGRPQSRAELRATDQTQGGE